VLLHQCERDMHHAQTAEPRKLPMCKNKMQIRTMYRDAPLGVEVKVVVVTTVLRAACCVVTAPGAR
jgi:hypothetical protein